jgi:hypothetical protein
MRTEQEIQSDIDTLTGDYNNLQTVVPPLSGLNLTFQQTGQKLLDVWKELATVRGGGVMATADAGSWKKKK